MTNTPFILAQLPLLATLVWAAAQDSATRRLPNWLTFGLILSGLLRALLPGQPVTPGGAILGLLVGGGLLFPQFAIRAIGGGDVKLMAGVGAWLGCWPVVLVVAGAAIVGMLIALTQAAWEGKFRMLLRNSAVVAVNVANISQLGVDSVAATGKTYRSIEKPLPYAVPVLASVVVVLLILK
jgi:prepilin peptidase CpaA